MTRILVIDDRPINRQFLTTLLRLKRFETREASDGAEGLAVVREWAPDLAIVDIEMPVMDGAEFVARLRQDTTLPQMPIIFYTASYQASEANRKARECGVGWVLIKPSEPEVILETIDKALGRQANVVLTAQETASSDFVKLQSGALRTTALVEFQLEIAVQRHRKDILNILCKAARHIIASDCAAVILTGEEIVASSRDDRFASAVKNQSSTCAEHVREMISRGQPVRMSDKAHICALWNAEVTSYLGVPIQTSQETYGWLCILNRHGMPEYSEEDERIAVTIAAQTATAYENLRLYEKLREEATLLDRSVNLLRATIEASAGGILVIDRDDHYVTYNREFVDMWGMPASVLESGDADASNRYVATQLKEPQAFENMVRLARRGEEVAGTCEMNDDRIFECHCAPRLFAGEAIGRVWSFRDITSRVTAEDALRESEEKYRSLIAHIPDVTWTIQYPPSMTFVSANVEAMYGFTPAEMLAGTGVWIGRVHDADKPRVMSGYQRLFAGGEPLDQEFRVQRKDGAWIWVHTWSIGTYVRDGVVYADGVIRDITARKNADAELRRLARDRELLLESTGDGIYAMDNYGRCTMANRTAAMLLERTIDEIVGQPIHALIHHHKPDGSVYPAEECAIYRAFKRGEASRVTDEVFWRKDGTPIPVEYVSSPLIDDGLIRGAVVTFSDVTERRKLERRVEQISRVSSLGRMAATIAHEFNNVLMGIQPFAEILRRRGDSDPKLQQAATQILTSVNRGKNITQDILRVTRPPEPAVKAIDVTEWLEALGAEIRAQLPSTIRLVVDAPPRQTLFSLCDPAQMQQVVMNLALNARDAMSAGGTLTLSASRSDAVRIVISDTGCGIAAETLPFIFEPLFTTKKSGTGLGLAVAQQLVVRNAGTIAVESTVGSGTRFQIELPAADGAQAETDDDLTLSPDKFGVRRVLVVEDDEAVASGLTSMLEAESVKVRVVATGGEAVDAVASFSPDVVLIDISLPDIDGGVVYERIASRWPSKPVIFSTGHADESCVRMAGKHVGFLRKPYSTQALLEKLREVV